ncbi:MAG TPA: hypothetical protein VND20_06320 [Candidatus Binataceae bacterium]|nr:hypothetical protein [Candidatus Binataceae bacterium]
MKVERLDQLKTIVDAGAALSHDDCAALITELWRLKSALAGKTIEADYLRASVDEGKRDLEAATVTHQALRREFEAQKALHGVSHCDLEKRWSNCAIRIRRRDGKI